MGLTCFEFWLTVGSRRQLASHIKAATASAASGGAVITPLHGMFLLVDPRPFASFLLMEWCFVGVQLISSISYR